MIRYYLYEVFHSIVICEKPPSQNVAQGSVVFIPLCDKCDSWIGNTQCFKNFSFPGVIPTPGENNDRCIKVIQQIFDEMLFGEKYECMHCVAFTW